MALLKEIMLVYVSVNGNGKSGNNGNNNKFYKMELYEDGSLIKTYGRIGTNGTKINSNGGEKEFLKIQKAKEKKGYTELKIEENSISSNSSINLENIVLSQINYKDSESETFLKYIINENIHNVISNTKIKFDIKTGTFSTPLGIIKKEAVEEAKQSLIDIRTIILNNGINNSIHKNNLSSILYKQFISLNEKYFSIIPTKISTLKDFYNLIYNITKVNEQDSICDSLISSIDLITQEKNKLLSDKSKEIEKYFNTSISVLKDKTKIDKIEKYFENSKNKKHGNFVNKTKINKIYEINIDKEIKNFDDSLDNIMELWHGTKVCNLLSILKTSLLMPKESPGQTTGYMFGQGLYFSNQSTKSLNYCDGMYWNNTKRSKYIYIFLCSVAMGNIQVPKGYTNKKPNSGFDSYWAKPNQSGIKNDEMIVFNNKQIRLDYLLELKI